MSHAGAARTGHAPTDVRLPPAPRIPKALQGIAVVTSRRRMVQQLARRYGNVFTLNIPVYGRTIVVSDPQLAKQIFTTSAEELGFMQPNSSRLVGSGSMTALEGDDHRQRRRLLAPLFHGRSIKNYENIFEQETRREIARWPEGKAFPTLPSTRRIALNAILHAIFGSVGTELDELRRIILPFATIGTRLVLLPKPNHNYGRYSPWGRLAELRRRYDALVDKLIDDERSDPNFEKRTDMLALMLRSTYEDGSTMSRKDIRDEVLSLLINGHETTAATLCWAFERLSRHPDVLTALEDEADTDRNELRQAAILEVQRARTILDFAGRHVYAPLYELGEWVIPRGYSIAVSLWLIHANPDEFPAPDRFDPQRYIGTRPTTFTWIPFGGGTRRCVGATFANVELDVVLRTVLRQFSIETTQAPGEKWHSRGIAYTPKDGGQIVVHRRDHRPLKP